MKLNQNDKIAIRRKVLEAMDLDSEFEEAKAAVAREYGKWAAGLIADCNPILTVWTNRVLVQHNEWGFLDIQTESQVPILGALDIYRSGNAYLILENAQGNGLEYPEPLLEAKRALDNALWKKKEARRMLDNVIRLSDTKESLVEAIPDAEGIIGQVLCEKRNELSLADKEIREGLEETMNHSQ